MSFIAKKYKMTPERVRQICGEPLNQQHILEQVRQNYKKGLKTQKDYKFILKETARLSEPSRRKEDVLHRRELVRYLYDEHELSFPQIGKLLTRDHTSIMNLYYGNKS